MSGVKHTPGPWKTADAYFSGDRCVRSVADDVWIAGHFAQAAAGGRAIAEANACLIAAAPELLEALEPFATAIMHLRSDIPGDAVIDLRIDGNHIFYQVPLSRFRDARAAITRATGPDTAGGGQ
jgi:hypothetical protein